MRITITLLFSSMRLKVILVMTMLVISSSMALAQNTITGRVSALGEGLPGATVVIDGTVTGTSTDINGDFSILATDGATHIVVSYIGYISQRIAINNQSIINVELETDDVQLADVVIVGYGSQKKSDVTGAVVRADLDKYREQGNTSIVQSLQGTVAGLNVGVSTEAGSNVTLSVRGNNTLSNQSGANQPLIVVDGIIFRGSLQDINPDDVGSIDVLKDASSAAIYGSQAANGVIIVTTKSGKVGDGKPKFSYSGRYTLKQDANKLEYGSGEDYLEQIRAFNWQVAYPQGPDYDPNDLFDPTSGLSANEFTGYQNGANVDWQDLLTRNGFVNNHNLSISGKTESITYFISGSFLDNEEVIRGDNFSKLTGRVNLDLKLTDWLRIGTNSFVTSGDYSGIEFNRSHYTFSPYANAYDENGDIIARVTNRFGNSTLLDENDIDEDKRKQLNSTIYAIVDIPWVDGLSYRMNYNNSYRTNIQNQFLFAKVGENAEASKALDVFKDWTLDHIISYNKVINDLHSIGGTFVVGREERQIDNSLIEAFNIDVEATSFHNLSTAQEILVESDFADETSLYQMGRINYSYNGKYFFTGTVRRDGFSGFGAANKTAIFPTAALGWTISEEDFFEGLRESVNSLKLRASYGVSGNRGLNRYRTLARVEQSPSYAYVFGDGGSTVTGQETTTIASPELKWETTTGVNIGLDFGLFNNRIFGNLEYYNTNTEDIIVEISIPSVNGFTRTNANLGKVNNHGFELSLTSINVERGDFQWSSTINLSRNVNEVVSVLGRDDDGDGIEDNLIETDNNVIEDDEFYGYFIGQSLGAIYTYEIDPDRPIYNIGDEDILPGFEPGFFRLVDQNGDGAIRSDDDKVLQGNQLPAYRWSLQNNFKYKNWSLSIFLNSIQGGKNGYLGRDNWWDVTQWDAGGRGQINGLLPTIVDYWSPDNPNSEGPGVGYGGRQDDIIPVFLRSRSFVRLQDVTLSYSFNQNILDKIGLTNLSLVLSGRNLALWAKDWPGLDPEANAGISYARPVTRSYTFGMTVGF